MWKDYFGEKARIIGIDNNSNAKYWEKYGFQIFIGNQSDEKFWNSFKSKVGKVDILLDDGGHIDYQQAVTLFENIDNINFIEITNEAIEGSTADILVRKGVSHVPEGREVFPMLSVEQNLIMGAYTRNNKAEIKSDIELFCTYFPVLESRFKQQALTLSGGEQQMLAIARGLMSKPKILLLDEPSLGLSPKLVKEIFGILLKLNKDQGVTILLVEQNAKAALDIADFGYVMELGRIVLHGKSSDLRESRDVQEFYLGVNQNSQLDQKRWKNRKTWR